MRCQTQKFFVLCRAEICWMPTFLYNSCLIHAVPKISMPSGVWQEPYHLRSDYVGILYKAHLMLENGKSSVTPPIPNTSIQSVLQGIFPNLNNQYIPDMLIINEKERSIIIGELTVPWEENINAANERKNAKYKQLVSLLERKQ